MKILVFCQYYYPEPFRVADICEELVKRGHDVSVITGYPEYPEGVIYDEYKDKTHEDEIINGVKVHRTHTVGRKGGVIKRFLNYYSYANSSKRYAKRLKADFDIVFCIQLSPVMMANGAIAYAKKHKKHFVMYVMDLWPASLALGGIKQGNPVYNYYYKISKRIYASADRLFITSESFRTYLTEQFDIGDEKIDYLPQYAEDLFTTESCKKVPNGTVDLMFAGNIGKAQSVETIIKAAELCKDIPNLRWHIVGDGSSLESCKALASKFGQTSVIFYGRKPASEMPKYYAMADAMLITMYKNDVISMTLPGKTQSYLAAGKAIIGAIDGEANKVIAEANCGLCGEAENAEMLAVNVRAFCQKSKAECDIYCKNARTYYEEHFMRNKLMDEMERILQNESLND